MPRLAPAGSRHYSAAVEDRSPLWWLRWIPAAVLTAVILWLTMVIGQLAIIPVLSSFSIAYVVNPIVEWFERRKLSRPAAALVALTLVSLGIVLFLWFVIPDLWYQSVKAGGIIFKNLNETTAQEVRRQIRQFSPLLDQMVGLRTYRILRDPNSLLEMSQGFLTGGLAGFVSSAASAFDLLIIPFFVYYILVDFERWRISFDDLIPPRFREPFSRLFDEVGRILQAYVLGQLMIAIIMGILYAIGFAAFRVPAWAGLAALSGFLNVIPYVGTASGLILASGFTFADTGEIWRVAGVIGVFLAVQTIEGYYLTPRILGGRLSLHPMAVFLGLLIGGRMFGLLGVLLAVPTLAIMQVFLKFLREIYRTSDFYRAGETGPEAKPEPVEDMLARAADTVLAEQVEKQQGDEVLAPSAANEDQRTLHKS
ncbi:MAG: AI-2E family transporter [Bryobacteraceae bacterium]|nr:AI-2E family transporter [Bryobacteraceae bacterium]